MVSAKEQWQEWKTQQTTAARYAVCKSCEKFNSKTYICEECWCFMPIKTTLLASKCPLDKWKE